MRFSRLAAEKAWTGQEACPTPPSKTADSVLWDRLTRPEHARGAPVCAMLSVGAFGARLQFAIPPAFFRSLGTQNGLRLRFAMATNSL
jgi:hypothetical protein